MLPMSLKTPLSAIKILAESLIHMGGDVPDIYIEFLNDINEEIDRLNAIITDLLSLVKMDDQTALDQKDPVNLSELVDRTVNSLRVLTKERYYPGYYS